MICMVKYNYIYIAKSSDPENPIARWVYNKDFFKETAFCVKDFTDYDVVEFPKELRIPVIIGCFTYGSVGFMERYI